MRQEKKTEQIEMELPRAFCEKMRTMLGDEYEAFIESYDRSRVQGLRLNPWKVEEGGAGDTTEVPVTERGKAWKKAFGLCRVPWVWNGFYYDGESRPGKNPLHEAGAYYIQEPSAMAVVELLNLCPGQKCLDLCAAPGGKSTQAAGKLLQTGLLVSNEIHPARAKILSQNMERMGVGNGVVTNEDSGRLASYFPEFFDRIVVDAPCSGEGMFRKDEQARQEWSPENVKLCAFRQAEILDNAASMLKPDGYLVYSTCTFSKEENEESIEKFLERHPDFEVADLPMPSGFAHFSSGDLPGSFRIWPHKTEGEGHFLALVHKKGGQPSEEVFLKEDKKAKKKEKGRQGVRKNDEWEPLWQEFEKETLNVGVSHWPLSEGNFTMFGEELYLVPVQMVDMKGLKVLRPGLDLGSVRKKRLEPSHALALYLKREWAKQWIDLPSDGEEVLRYLRGETLDLNSIAGESHLSGVNGWVLVCTDGCSLGWGKKVGATLKNHYPKGLRRP